jgi:hypothetical protein
VLAQVAVEVGLAYVVHQLNEMQDDALRAWVEQVSVGTMRNPQQVALVNALLAPSGERIDGDMRLWSA